VTLGLFVWPICGQNSQHATGTRWERMGKNAKCSKFLDGLAEVLAKAGYRVVGINFTVTREFACVLSVLYVCLYNHLR
jgi:hypothetical protein